MKFIYDYELFVEARLSDIAIFRTSGYSYSEESDDDKFLKFKTISKRIDNKKIRLEIKWNHSLKHDLIQKLKDRTNLKNISELNELLNRGLDELYIHNYKYIKDPGIYSLWFSEYNFSIISEILNEKINIITILPGQRMFEVKNIIEIKSKL